MSRHLGSALRGGSRRLRGAVPGVLAAILTSACQDGQAPIPEPFPPNIRIRVVPEPGARVEAAAAESVVLDFDRAMDPASLRNVRRMSFLLPLSLGDLGGEWSRDHRRVTYRLDAFPVQPGALYEAVFAGLRTADGNLYNLGPLRLHFWTRGRPDLVPLQPHARIAERGFCHRLDGETTCTHTSEMHARAVGVDSVAWRWTCGECGTDRRQLFRRRGDRIEWLGTDDLDAPGAPSRSLRWPEPPPLVAFPAEPGTSLPAAPQTASDGTRLAAWRVTIAQPDSPAYVVATGALPITLVFSECTVLDIEYRIVPPGDVETQHHERWWLYAGVGLVRRDVERRRDGVTNVESFVFTPALPDGRSSD